MVLDIEGRTKVLFIAWFARNDVVAFGMRIRLGAGLFRDREPWATSSQVAKSNHGAFLTESERTSVNCEIVRSGYHAAQRMLEREAVHETFAISDATVFQHTGGIAFGVAEFTQRIPGRVFGRAPHLPMNSTPSSHPPSTTFLHRHI